MWTLYFCPVVCSFFCRLISAVGDWMSTMLPHIVWPKFEFRMQVWNVLCVAHWKWRTPKIAIWAPLRNFFGGYIFATEAHIDKRKKNLLNSNVSPRCAHNMVNFGPSAAEICWLVWGTPADFNRFHVLAALLHGTLVVGVSQTLRRWIEGVTYIQQGGHPIGHWSTFLVDLVMRSILCLLCLCRLLDHDWYQLFLWWITFWQNAESYRKRSEKTICSERTEDAARVPVCDFTAGKDFWKLNISYLITFVCHKICYL